MFERQKTIYHSYQRLYIPVAGLILGISSSYYLHYAHYGNALSLALTSLFMLFYFHKTHKNTKIIFLFSSFFLIGACALYLEYYSAFNSQKPLPRKNCDIVVCIKDKNNNVKPDENEIIDLLILKIKACDDQIWNNTKSIIRVYAKSKSLFQIGDILHIKNIILTIPPQTTDLQGIPSFADYLHKEGLNATMFIPRLQGILLHRPVIHLPRSIANSRNSMLGVGTTTLNSLTKSLYATIFLGKKEPNLMRKQWRNWGILHLLARSGIHAVVFLILCMFFFKKTPLNYPTKQICFLIILVSYVLLSWPSTSFLRAIFIIISTLLGKLFCKQVSLIHSLCALTLFSLCTNPLQLFFLDFQLSYGLTFIIMWWTQQSKAIK